jgi:hypothetical protein
MATNQLETEIEMLQHQIDVHSALCLACANNTDPEVVRRRTNLEASITEARALLRRLAAGGTS